MNNFKKKLTTTVTLLTVLLTPTLANAETKYVEPSIGLNYRTGDSVKSQKIGALPYGASVEVLDITESNWAKVQIGDNVFYMSNEYLSDTPLIAEPIQQAEPIETESVETTSHSCYSLGTYRITHYCGCANCNGSWAGSPTASGAYPVAGRTVAMADLPFGTEVEINGQIYTVEDRGVPSGCVDIYVDNHSEALNSGMYYAEVRVVG